MKFKKGIYVGLLLNVSMFFMIKAIAEVPKDMILISGGEFTMGTDSDMSMPNERPARKTKVKDFYIDVVPVTNKQFAEFVDATDYVTTAERPIDWEKMKKQVPPGTMKPPKEMLQPGALVFTPPKSIVDLRVLSNWWSWVPGANWRHPEGPESTIQGRENHPVVQVSWDDAKAYAMWANKRLPTEAEWEYAAKGGLENRRYFWGDVERPKGKIMANSFQGTFPFNNTVEDGYMATSPVKSFPANGYGLFDMAGNVWNWTADRYQDSPRAPVDPFSRVVKGGSFLCHKSYCESYRPSARRGVPADTGSAHVGFRCAKSVDGTAE